MRTAAAALVLGVMFTVEQRDVHRASIDAASAAVSGDGRYVAFVSYSQLAPADSNQRADVYVLDRTRQHVTLESVDQAGRGSIVANPRLSGDGRILVYGRDDDVIMRDRASNTMRVLGNGRQPSVSYDGSTVAFVTETDVYLKRLTAPDTVRVSLAMPGLESLVTWSVAPSVSGDGRFVAFAARAAQGPRHKPATSHIFIRDTQLNVTRRISTGWFPIVTSDGGAVVFLDYARGVPHVFFAEVASGAIRAVSNNPRGRLANGGSANLGMSSDGRFIVFQSDASDLVDAEDYNLLPDVFVFDRAAAAMTRVSGDPDGAWLAPSGGPSIDNLGSVVAFSSRHPTDASDKQNDFDLYVVTLDRASEGRKKFEFLATRKP